MSADNPYAATDNDNNPYAAPTKDGAVVQQEANDIPDDLGGLTRGHYWLCLLGLIVLSIIPIAGLLNFILSPIISCFRMKNVGYHPALGILAIVPIANIWVGLICAAGPTGYRYSKKLDTIGKVIMGIIIGLIVLLVIALVLPAMM